MGRLAALAAGGLCVAALAACGGDDGDDTPIVPVETETEPTSGLDKAEYVERADRLCAEANTAIANLSGGSTASPEVQASQEREILESMLDNLRDLGTPSEDESALRSYLAALDDQASALEQQERGQDAAAEIAEAGGEARAAARRFGFRECGQEGEVVTPGAGTGTAPPGGDEAPAPVAPETPGAPAPAPTEPAPPPPPSGGAGPSDGGDGSGDSGGIGPG